jgi:hypothetical protein
MTAAADYQHLHELIDRLTPRQVRHLRALAEDLAETPAVEQHDTRPHAGSSRSQRLSFVGIGRSGLGDLAENADRYLDEGFGTD